MFKKILIANRGEIACRVIRTLERMGIASVAVYSEADAQPQHVAAAGQAVRLGHRRQRELSSRAADHRISDCDRAEAIHPGYGFLSENPEFAQMCADAGIVFIGPTPQQMRSFGLKHTARELARRCEVPMAPDRDSWKIRSSPEGGAENRPAVMLKATAGGGGIGMRLCREESELADAFAAVQRLGRAISNTPACTWRSTSIAPGTSRCKSSAMGRQCGCAGERDCSPSEETRK